MRKKNPISTGTHAQATSFKPALLKAGSDEAMRSYLLLSSQLHATAHAGRARAFTRNRSYAIIARNLREFRILGKNAGCGSKFVRYLSLIMIVERSGSGKLGWVTGLWLPPCISFITDT